MWLPARRCCDDDRNALPQDNDGTVAVGMLTVAGAGRDDTRMDRLDCRRGAHALVAAPNDAIADPPPPTPTTQCPTLIPLSNQPRNHRQRSHCTPKAKLLQNHRNRSLRAIYAQSQSDPQPTPMRHNARNSSPQKYRQITQNARNVRKNSLSKIKTTGRNHDHLPRCAKINEASTAMGANRRRCSKWAMDGTPPQWQNWDRQVVVPYLGESA